MTTDDYKKGEQDALLGTTASGTTEEYVQGFFDGLKKTNPLFRRLDEHSFKEGYFGRNQEGSHNSSYLAGVMVRKISSPSQLEKKVEATKIVPAVRSNDPEWDRIKLDTINEQRWENDLPPLTREDQRERLREEMWEIYNYDIDK